MTAPARAARPRGPARQPRPQTIEEIARAYYVALAGMSAKAAREAGNAFTGLDVGALVATWTAAGLGEQLFARVAAWQLLAAQLAARYVDAALAVQGSGAAASSALVPSALAGVASDGRDLQTLLEQPLIQAVTAATRGATSEQVLDTGVAAMTTIVNTQVSDAGRAATLTAMTAHPAAGGWVRMLVPPSCGRCAVLAGRYYRWSDGFDRHPMCDCVHIPAAEDTPRSPVRELRTDPRAYFDSLSPAEQNRYFTQSGAEAIRLGSDVAQVVNARRGAAGLSIPGRLTDAEQDLLRGGRRRARLARVDVYGRAVFITSEGTTTRGAAGRLLIERAGATDARGSAARRADRARGDVGRRHRRARTPRLMPEAILEIANGDREQALRLLERFGYITAT